MGDTVTNHELLVCTKGTSHKAQTTGDTDVCFNPPKLVASPHPNYVSTRQLGGGQTTKTFIQTKPIVTLKGVIEPMSLPAHADTGGGVVSGTYCLEAKPTGGSPDVMAEGSPVCRTTDPTTQNHANTTGTFVETSKAEQLAMDEQDRVARCTIIKVVGDCAGPAGPDMSKLDVSGPAILSGNAHMPGQTVGKAHGRELGFPPGSQPGVEGYWLAVLSTDTVTLKATRKNAVEKGDPVCVQKLHTKWVVKRSGGGEDASEKETIGTDELVIGPDWLDVPSIEEFGLKPGSRSKDKKYDPGKAEDVTKNQNAAVDAAALKDKPRDATEQEVFDRRAAGHTNIGAAKRHHAARQEAERAEHREAKSVADQKASNKAAQNTLKVAMNVVQNAAKLYYYWNYMNNPVTLEVTALGCSGSKNATIVCYPVGKFEFDLFSDKIAENVAVIKKLGDLGKKIAGVFGKYLKGNWEFLKDPQLLLACEYKELMKDHNGLTKAQVNRAWELSIGFGKMVEFSVEFNLPLLNFFGPMGVAANTFLNALGIEGNGFIAIIISVNPKVMTKWTEYNEGSILEFKVTVKIEVQLGARGRWRDIAEIYGNGYVEASVDFTEPSVGADHYFKCKAKGALQIGVKAGGYASWWGFSKSFQIDYKPPDWKYALGDRELQIAKQS